MLHVQECVFYHVLWDTRTASVSPPFGVFGRGSNKHPNAAPLLFVFFYRPSCRCGLGYGVCKPPLLFGFVACDFALAEDGVCGNRVLRGWAKTESEARLLLFVATAVLLVHTQVVRGCL